MNSPTEYKPEDENCATTAWTLRLPLPRTQPVPSDAANQPPLSGLVFAVKDNIDVAGVPTTAACPAFAYIPTENATVVHRLLQAGAMLTGKTNLDQFACGLNGTRSPYGIVPNAFNSRYVSGGSSSGSAHVVATGVVDFALGTDTAGSGRVPAALNNIVGLKPTRGLIDAKGVVPAARSVDTVSIFGSSVAIAWQVLTVAAGFDDPNSLRRKLPLRLAPFPANFRVGVPDMLEFYGDASSEAAFSKALALLADMGATERPIPFAPLQNAARMLYDSALVAERYAAIRPFFDSHEEHVIEPVRSIIARGRQYSGADVFDAQAELSRLAEKCSEIWSDIDVLVVPSVPCHITMEAMLADPVEQNRRLGHYTNFVNLLDYAALSVPASLLPDGLPFGITLIAPAGSDWALAELGARFHARTGLFPGVLRDRVLAHAEELQQPRPDGPMVEVAVVGAHLSGMPLNSQLTERGARRLVCTHTADHYRLYALAGTNPPKPGLQRVASAQGAPIEVEVWQMPVREYGSFIALIPAPLGIGRIDLRDGSQVQGFLCEAQALTDARDITHFGGWRAYLKSLAGG